MGSIINYPRSERIKGDLALLSVSIIWGSAFVVQRIAAREAGVFFFNGLRFLVGAVVLLPFLWKGTIRNQTVSPSAGYQHTFPVYFLTGWGGIFIAGALLFSGAALQQWGLQYTTAGNAGFITGLYVVLIPLILAFGWRQVVRAEIWMASSLAAVGLFLLSTGGRLAFNPGDLLELAGSFFWAFHVLLISRLVRKVDATSLAAGQYLTCGLLNLAAGLFLETGAATFEGLAGSWWTILYTGVLSVGLGYTLQIIGQKTAPPADAAILLSLEAVFAALFGWLFLAEALGLVQLAGCGLILAGMLVAQINSLRGGNKEAGELNY